MYPPNVAWSGGEMEKPHFSDHYPTHSCTQVFPIRRSNNHGFTTVLAAWHSMHPNINQVTGYQLASAGIITTGPKPRYSTQATHHLQRGSIHAIVTAEAGSLHFAGWQSSSRPCCGAEAAPASWPKQSIEGLSSCSWQKDVLDPRLGELSNKYWSGSQNCNANWHRSM